jgi:putative salt-induced outer membrane protein YdiY
MKRHLLLATLIIALSSGAAVAQQVASTTTKAYTGNLGGGLARTGGNTRTSNFNLTATLVRDLKTKSVIKGNVTYLRGVQDDILNLNRTLLNIRDEYTVSGRTFVFGQLDYLRDEFKQMIFFWAPTAGVGYKVFGGEAVQLTVDGGAGTVIEKNPGIPTSKSGSVTTGERLNYRISPTAAVTHSLATIWKTEDFSDSLTNLSLGVTSTLIGNLQIKLEFLDSYKNKPADVLLKRNDTALVTTFVLKF